MPKSALSLFLTLAALGLTACDKTHETYPVSGQQCGPEDPVKTLDAADCNLPLAPI